MILVTGASGNTGRAVLRAVLDRSLPVRAMYRSQADVAGAPEGADAIIADFADPASLRRALDGVTAAFVVCAPIPQLVELERNMLAACGEVHVVLSSAIGAGGYGKSYPSWHAQVEETLRSSGPAWTILRPNGYMQNLAAYNAPSIRTEGAFYASLGEGRVSLIDVRDLGDAAAAVLADPARHRGQTYELNGPEAVSNGEIARRISALLGVEVRYVDLPEAAQREAMLGAGMPDWQVTALLDLQALYRSGACGAVDGTVAALTGRPPRTLDAYLAENAAAFRPERKP